LLNTTSVYSETYSRHSRWTRSHLHNIYRHSIEIVLLDISESLCSSSIYQSIMIVLSCDGLSVTRPVSVH